jgi:NTE family protein
MSIFEQLHSKRVGLALSGGVVRGLAHIGVIKALTEQGIRPAIIAGTSAGSLVGAGFAAGMDWQALAEMARSVFWPSLLNGRMLERFCERHLPVTFEQLCLPFAAMATEFPARRSVALTEGRLDSALSASCALRIIRRPVKRAGLKLKDGGYTCVLPAALCRELGADFVISSDVWELSSLLRKLGCQPLHPLFPAHYHAAVRCTDLLIQPAIPALGYFPGVLALERFIAAGEQAAHGALANLASLEAA